MAQASPSVRAQVVSLAMDLTGDRLDWDDFLQLLPEGIGDDAAIHELIELLAMVPSSGMIDDQVTADHKTLILEKIAALGEGRAI
jgi:Uma2 family endonuclease